MYALSPSVVFPEGFAHNVHYILSPFVWLAFIFPHHPEKWTFCRLFGRLPELSRLRPFLGRVRATDHPPPASGYRSGPMTEKSMSKKLQGQVALVTGGGRGIGAAAAELLARAGAAVVLTARSEEEIDAVAKRIRKAGGKAIAVPCDVSDFGQIEEVVESALDQFNRLDILINNAAVVWPLEEVADSDPDEWAYNIHVNLVGPYNMARNVLPLMVDQGYGRILNITSGAARGGIVGSSAYSAAKAGLDAFTRTLAAEVAGTGVTVNGLNPGSVDTEMQADLRSVDTEGTRLDFSYFHEAYEQGRLGSPATTARQIYWLVGPWGRNETGKIFSAGDEEWRAQVEKDIA